MQLCLLVSQNVLLDHGGLLLPITIYSNYRVQGHSSTVTVIWMHGYHVSGSRQVLVVLKKHLDVD